MDSDLEDFVFYGTPIEREEDSTSRKKKAIAESAGQLRTLPAWKQEVSFISFNRIAKIVLYNYIHANW